VSDGRNHFTHDHNSSQLYRFGETNPYVEAFFKWWETDLHKTLQELRITGGEPLMSGDTWKLLEWFNLNKGRSHTRLAINSNLGMEYDVIERAIDACDGTELDIYTSNEAFGVHAEYIRDGLSWPQWVYNMRHVMKSKRLRGLHVMCTVNALCLESLPDFLDQLMVWKSEFGADFPNFTLNILRFPSFQSPLILPAEHKTRHKNRLEAWLKKWDHTIVLQEHERNHVQRLIDYLDAVKTPHSEAFDMPKLLNDFKQFFTQYDQRRNKNFVETFPNLKEWYESIQI
jgi:hypothetical protein